MTARNIGIGVGAVAVVALAAIVIVRQSVPSAAEAKTAVLSLLQAQATAWDAGDRDALLKTFAPIDRTGQPRPAGWQDEVLRRYFRAFGRMGQGTLRLHDLAMTLNPAGDIEVSALGTVMHEGRERHGALELLLRRYYGVWLVVDEEDIPTG